MHWPHPLYAAHARLSRAWANSDNGNTHSLSLERTNKASVTPPSKLCTNAKPGKGFAQVRSRNQVITCTTRHGCIKIQALAGAWHSHVATPIFERKCFIGTFQFGTDTRINLANMPWRKYVVGIWRRAHLKICLISYATVNSCYVVSNYCLRESPAQVVS